MIRPANKMKRASAKVTAALCAAALIATPICVAASQSALSFAEDPQPLTKDVTSYALEAAMGIPGYDSALAFLNGNDVPLEKLKQIDLAALGSLYPKLAASISQRIAQLEAEAAAQSPTAPSDGAGQEGAGDGATEGDADSDASVGNGSASDGSESSGSGDASNGEDASGSQDASSSDSGAEGDTTASDGAIILPAAPGSDADIEADAGYSAAPGDVVPAAAVEAFVPNAEYPQWTYEGDTTYVTRHYTDNWDTERFVAVIGEQARQVAQERDLYASLMIAKAVLVSDSGLSADYLASGNLFGMASYDEGAAATQAAVSMYQSQVAVHPLAAAIIGANGQAHAEISVDKAAEASLPLVDIVMQDAHSAASDNGASNGADAVAGTGEAERFQTDMESLDDFGRRLRVLAQIPGSEVRRSQSDDWRQALDYLVQVQAVEPDEAERMAQVVEDYELTRFDEALDYELAQPIKYEQVDAFTGETVQVELSLADLVAKATQYLGVPYLWGGTTPDGFDCSGLVQYAYRHALGIDIPRTTYYQCTQGQDVNFADLHMGDLLFFVRNGVAGHVAMYLGDGYYIEAPSPGATVKITSLDEKMPTFAKRILVTQDKDI